MLEGHGKNTDGPCFISLWYCVHVLSARFVPMGL